MQKGQEIKDMCSFVITRVYGMYDQYLNKILDAIISQEYDTLNHSLNDAISAQNQEEQITKDNLNKVNQWLDSAKLSYEKQQKEKTDAYLSKRLKEVEFEKQRN